MSDAAWAAATLALDRWARRQSQARQDRVHDRALQRFLARELAAAPFYARYSGRPLESLPIVDKATVLRDFAAFNRHGIELAQALEVAEAAERGRDFAPMIGDITVGMSSGTSGRRGVFLVSTAERRRWAGAVMAQMLSRESLSQVLMPSAPPLRVALFLRANSNLYTTLSSRRVEFVYFDINQPIEQQAQRLCAHAPDVLVGPPSVLRLLAELCGGRFRPRQVVAVAETLEPDDKPVIEAAFGVRVEQIYQATEGLLGFSCPDGRIHLNERYVHIEPEWIDERRFHPIVTDFSRTTQFVVRYRLDDVLLDARGRCPCGRPSRSVESVLGRADDVLYLRGLDGSTQIPVFPDVLRRAMALVGEQLADYRIEQRYDGWHLMLRAPDQAAALAAVTRELTGVCQGLVAELPVLRLQPWTPHDGGQKRRRMRCVVKRRDALPEAAQLEGGL